MEFNLVYRYETRPLVARDWEERHSSSAFFPLCSIDMSSALAHRAVSIRGEHEACPHTRTPTAQDHPRPAP